MKKVLFPTLILILLLACGCSRKQEYYDEGYAKGLEDGYSKGYDDGYAEGFSDGSGRELEEEQTYILNKSSKKFHKPTCDSVSAMKESNKVERITTRTQLIEEGYSPCQTCKP